MVAGAVGGGAAAVSSLLGHATVNSSCTVTSSAQGTTYRLAPDQAQDAAIIAAVGGRMGLPDHAVTVALATALQESKLRNLPYGDLDSVGLFQQRPSQGWGTRAQLLDPVQAATAFYARLTQITGWETMAVADAGQAVQQSADGSAYAQWESEARAFAVALTGEAPAAFTCRLAGFAGAAPLPGALAAAAPGELGRAATGAQASTKEGWAAAYWIVAHAWQYHVHQVGFAGWRWTSSSGRWSRTSGSGAGAADPSVVTFG